MSIYYVYTFMSTNLSFAIYRIVYESNTNILCRIRQKDTICRIVAKYYVNYVKSRRGSVGRRGLRRSGVFPAFSFEAQEAADDAAHKERDEQDERHAPFRERTS